MDIHKPRCIKHLVAIGVVVVCLPVACVQAATLVATNAVWKYLDNGSNQGTAWRAAGFNDSGWASGPAIFGFGLGGEATVVSYGGNPQDVYITTYFRHKFIVTETNSFNSLWVRLMRDDGVIAFLNGTEVFRNNMDEGTIEYDDTAASHVGDVDAMRYHTFRISKTPLVTGTNVLAVEVHQISDTSDDLRFTLELIATTTFVSEGDIWKYFKGTSFPSGWTTNGYNDTAWLSGPSGFGYGDSDDNTVLGDMQGLYASVFTRKKFVLPSSIVLSNVMLIADYDDGYVAHLNGTEVARGSMPAGPVSNTTLAFEHEASGSDPDFEDPMPKELVPIDPNLMVAFTNTLAVSGHNVSLSSSDFSLIIELIADVIPDNVPPALAIVAPVGITTTLVSSVAVTGTATDVTAGVQDVYVNGIPANTTNGFTNWSVNVTGLLPGTNALTAIARDKALPANSATSVVQVIYVDANLPSLNIVSPPNLSTVSVDPITVTGTATDPGSGVASVKVNGFTASTSNLYTNWSAQVAGLVVGTNTLTAIALDFGLPPNATTNAVQVIFADGIPPQLNINSPDNLSTTAVAMVVVTGTALDLHTGILGVEVNGFAASTSNLFTNWSVVVSGLTLGTNTLVAVATDSSPMANKTTNTVEVILVDIVPPVLMIDTPSNLSTTTVNSVIVSGTAQDALSGIQTVTVNGVSATTTNLFANWSATVAGLNVGTNTLTAIARDNALPANTATSVVQVIYVDEVAPLLSIVSPLDLSTTTVASVTLTGTATDPGSGVLHVKVNGATVTTGNAFTNWSISITGLVLGTNTLTAIATDHGQPPNTTTNILRVIFVDVTPPVIGISSPADLTYTTNASVTITGTATDTPSGILEVKVNATAATTANLFTNWSATVAGLTAGTNTLTAIALDNWMPANSATSTVRVIYATGSFDGDGNGLPDVWEIRYFGSVGVVPSADPDGDGQVNLAELAAGTDPTNSVSALRILEVFPENQDVIITWTTVGGKRYVLQTTPGSGGAYSNDFLDLNPAIVAPGSGESLLSVIHLGGAANVTSRFYRIRLSP